MRYLIYILIVGLLIVWSMGYFAYGATPNIHFLLAIALFILVIDLVRVKKGQ